MQSENKVDGDKDKNMNKLELFIELYIICVHTWTIPSIFEKCAVQT